MTGAIHHSYWTKQQSLNAKFDSLSGRHSTDVLVVGGGITGLTTALELATRGRRVTVCEAGVIGCGTTGGSTGHLDAHPEMGPARLLKRIGVDLAREYVSIRKRAIGRITQIASDHCDVTAIPAYHYSESESDRDSLNADCEAAQQIGLNAKWDEVIPIPRAKFGYRIESMARMDMGEYLKQLTQAAVQQGVQIFENTLVKGSTEENVTTLHAGDGEVQFEHVVGAVHCNFSPALHIYAATPAYQSYVLTARVASPIVDALYWDSSDPYYYVRRVRSDDDRLIMAGGCDHRTGVGNEAEAAQQLEAWVRERFNVTEITSRWSAELFEPTDGLPMIGKAYGDNLWVVTGLSGVGLTQGTAAAAMLADMLAGIEVPLAETFSPSRFAMGQPVHWLREQAVSAMDVAERILPAARIDPSTLAAGQGLVGVVDGEHVAICRDEDGCEHRLNPICTHMGGVVHWNEAEQTWDCPVHGGRFTASGERLYGPPQDKLEPSKSVTNAKE